MCRQAQGACHHFCPATTPWTLTTEMMIALATRNLKGIVPLGTHQPVGAFHKTKSVHAANDSKRIPVARSRLPPGAGPPGDPRPGSSPDIIINPPIGLSAPGVCVKPCRRSVRFRQLSSSLASDGRDSTRSICKEKSLSHTTFLFPCLQKDGQTPRAGLGPSLCLVLARDWQD